MESVARIGSYSLDTPEGRWVSSKGLDAIFGTLSAAFDRSVEGWALLLHAADRDGMLAHLFIGLRCLDSYSGFRTPLQGSRAGDRP